ncbi:MAG: hypothetical protein M1826_004695 [Phylliscum demangeonii]|nr:MAG: hypothetical protein M1826_004695 [Phylliscum demangeonii]
MPLRAKVLLPPAHAQMATLAPLAPIPSELADDEPDDVLFNSLYGIRTIELNRPQKLNSLNGSMARKIVPRLKAWESSQMANVIIIKGRGPKAFCAGGDVAAIAQQLPADDGDGDAAAGALATGRQQAAEYFALEYRLDHLIATYPKPYVAFMDGITMGGGAGLSMHAPFRIATERTVFAMPETTIGFFPDVGASFFLPRLDGRIGTYLALTSERVTGVNAFYTGIATHYLHSSSLPDLEGRLAELVFRDYDSPHERQQIVNATIEEYCTGLPHDEPMQLAGPIRAALDRCFQPAHVAGILSALVAEAAHGSRTSDADSSSPSPSPTSPSTTATPPATPPATAAWAQRTLDALRARSPTSVRVALAQMELGARWSIAEAFQREYELAKKFVAHPDFHEGVTARLLTKPARAPRWAGPSLEDEKEEQATTTTTDFFRVEGSQRLPLLNALDYTEYPHAWIALPSESEVERVVKNPPAALLAAKKTSPSPLSSSSSTSSSKSKAKAKKAGHEPTTAAAAAAALPPLVLTRNRVLQYFVRMRDGKQGVAEKVREILDRKTVVVRDGEVEGEGDKGEGEDHHLHPRPPGRCVWVD